MDSLLLLVSVIAGMAIFILLSVIFNKEAEIEKDANEEYKNSTQLLTLKEKLSSGELGPEYTVAWGALMALGLKPYQTQSSVLGLAKEQGFLTSCDFSEKYFLDEAAFSVALAMHFEEEQGFIQAIKSHMANKDRDYSSTRLEYILAAMLAIAPLIARERMDTVGVERQISDVDAHDYVKSSVNQYVTIWRNSENSNETIDTSIMRVGLSPRDHPLLEFLGLYADKLTAQFNIKSDDMQLMMIEMVVLTYYQGRLQAIGEL